MSMSYDEYEVSSNETSNIPSIQCIKEILKNSARFTTGAIFHYYKGEVVVLLHH